MAKIGLFHVVAAAISAETYGSLPTYDTGFSVGAAIEANSSLNYGDSPLYADNREVNNDTDFTDGTITIGVDEFGSGTSASALEIKSKLTGGTYTAVGESTPMTLQEGGNVDAAPVGIGYCKTGLLRDTKTKYYEATWYHKVSFKPSGEDAKSREKSTTWQTESVTGTIYTIPGLDDKTNLKITARFDTEAAAFAWLDAKANMAAANVAAE